METLKNCPFDPAIESNRVVFDYIKNLHAHDCVSEILLSSLKPCGDVQTYSPGGYRYVTASTQGIIFGFAADMDTIAFRLNKRMKAVALETGAKTIPQCGEDWVNLKPSQCDWPSVDYKFWALKAYLNIRESVGLA